jgi:DNA-binding transcriptional LysR family regulator
MLSNAYVQLDLCLKGMRVHLRHVKYFVATVDSGSVSAAATALHVGQPAVSRQLRQLERDLGVELFERTAGRLHLNRTGHALLPRARDLLDAATALHSAASMHAMGGLTRLTIAAPTVTLTDVVSPFVASMEPDDPVVEALAADGHTPAEMLAGEADLAIGTQRPPRPFASLHLASLPVWGYVRSDDPWASRPTMAIEELAERSLVVLPHTFTSREALEAAAIRCGISFSNLVEAGSGTIAQALAASGRGIAVVSDDPRFGLRPMAIVTHSQELLRVRLWVAWDQRGVAAPAIAAIARRLAAWTGRRYPDIETASTANPVS